MLQIIKGYDYILVIDHRLSVSDGVNHDAVIIQYYVDSTGSVQFDQSRPINHTK